MRKRFIAALFGVAALPLLGVRMEMNADADRGASVSAAAFTNRSAPPAVPARVQMTVRLSSSLSSETAQTGDPWGGTVATAVTVGGQGVIPAGSAVRGAVTGVQPAARRTRAMLDLAIQEVSIGGQLRPLTAGIEAMLAAPLPARQPEVRTGGAPTTSLMGSKTESGFVLAEQGSQVVINSGTELVFVVKEHAARH